MAITIDERDIIAITLMTDDYDVAGLFDKAAEIMTQLRQEGTRELLGLNYDYVENCVSGERIILFVEGHEADKAQPPRPQKDQPGVEARSSEYVDSVPQTVRPSAGLAAGEDMAKMSWRPENWKNPGKYGCTRTRADMFEKGADAMLKALKEKGAYMTPDQMRLIAPERQHPYGWLVFIPEDEEEK